MARVTVKGAFESRKEPIGSPKNDLLKVAKSSCGCYSRQVRVSAVKLEAIGPTEKKSRRHCIWIIWHTLQCHPFNEGRDRSTNLYIRV